MDLQNKQEILHHPLKLNSAKEIIKILKDFDCYYGIFYKGYGYLDNKQYDKELAKYENTPMYRYIKTTRKKVDSQKDFINSIDHCDNIYVIAKNSEIRDEIYQAIGNVNNIYYTCSEECDVEIGGNCSKGKTLLELASNLGIKPSEVMAIGDSGNDLNMLELAGFSVAMKNSSQSILDVADYVTKSCDNSGVAHSIRKFCL
jgi:hypothetical protein